MTVEENMAVIIPTDIVMDLKEGIRFLDPEPMIALDLETTGLSPWKNDIVVLAMYGPLCKKCVIWHDPELKGLPDWFWDWLLGPGPGGKKRLYVTHNGVSFDIPYLIRAGGGKRVYDVKWTDTLISEQVSMLTNRQGVSLAKVFQRRLGKDLKLKIDHSQWTNPFLTQEQIDYVTGDIKYLHEVRQEHLDVCAKDSRARALRVEEALMPVVVRMSDHGMPINMDKLSEYLAQQKVDAQKAGEHIHEVLGPINLNSPIQIKRAFEVIDEPIPDTTKETLVSMSQMHAGTELGDLFNAFVTHRYANQRLKMYSEEFIEKFVVWDPKYKCHMIHPRFKQMATDTGRFSSAEPNLQQVPRDMRWVYGDVEGYSVVSVDYSAIEVCAAAVTSMDENLINALKQQDIHKYVASQIFLCDISEVTPEQRQVAKAATFTLIFAGGASTMQMYAKQYGSDITLEEARVAFRRFFEAFPGLGQLRGNAYELSDMGGSRVLELPTGVRRILSGESLRPSTLLNTYIQGMAAAFMKYSLINLLKEPYRKETLADLLCATVHDETVLLVPTEDAEEVKDRVANVMIESAYATIGHRIVPIKAAGVVGPHWTK